MSKPAQLGGFAGPLYYLAVLLVGLSVLDFGATVWPFAPSQIEWRYGAVGILSGYLLTPLLGVMVVLMVSWFSGHRRTTRTAAITSLVVAVILVIAVTGFGLDALEVRRATSEELRRGVEIGAGKAALKLMLAAISLGWLGLAGLRATAGSPSAGRSTSPLVMRPGSE